MKLETKTIICEMLIKWRNKKTGHKCDGIISIEIYFDENVVLMQKKTLFSLLSLRLLLIGKYECVQIRYVNW